MSFILRCINTLLICGLAVPSVAETVQRTNGSDVFMAGNNVSQTINADHDVFASGSSVTLRGQAQGDVHVSGFDVDVETRTAGDLYAMGATVTVRAEIAEDLSAMGFSVRTSQGAETAGNARLLGQTVTIDGPVGGALTAMGSEVFLNAAIDGDAWIVAETITYGPEAVISGRLNYSSTSEITPPERVISADRVSFERLDRSEAFSSARETWHHMEYPVFPTFASIFAGFLITLAFFVIVGAIFLTFLPKPVERLRGSISERPGLIFLVGVIGLSILFGMVPITAMTVVGLPLVPFVLLAIVLAWTLGYILAAYAAGMRVWQAFGGQEEPSIWGRLAALAIAVIAIAILNFIPFIGWVANYTLVLLGIGAMTHMLFERLIGNPGPALDVDMKPIKD